MIASMYKLLPGALALCANQHIAPCTAESVSNAAHLMYGVVILYGSSSNYKDAEQYCKRQHVFYSGLVWEPGVPLLLYTETFTTRFVQIAFVCVPPPKKGPAIS